MALRNITYALESGGATMTAITVSTGDSVTSDGIKTENCVGASWLYVRFLDTSSCSLYREISYDNTNWGQAVLTYPWTTNTYFYNIASVITATAQFVSLAAIDSNIGVAPVVAPYTRFKVASERSDANISIWYIQQEEV